MGVLIFNLGILKKETATGNLAGFQALFLIPKETYIYPTRKTK
jgi:hypothetical protein